MTTCDFCYQGPLANHKLGFAPQPRDALRVNTFRWFACERHMTKLWTFEAIGKGFALRWPGAKR